MSQGETGKETKEKKKVPGRSIEEMKERPNIAVEEDTEEMKRWRVRWIYAGRIWRKEWKRKSWTSTKSKRAREEPSKVEETSWNGEECRQKFSLAVENTIFAAFAKQAGGVNRRG